MAYLLSPLFAPRFLVAVTVAIMPLGLAVLFPPL
jgi:hypothetical protein